MGRGSAGDVMGNITPFVLHMYMYMYCISSPYQTNATLFIIQHVLYVHVLYMLMYMYIQGK